MKILVVCSQGKNRSRYLAEYLVSRGFDAAFAGINSESQDEIQRKISAADTIITVHDSVKERMLELFDTREKRIVDLDVEDRPELSLLGSKRLEGEEWTAFQETFVYPKLREQIEKYIPTFTD